MNYELASVKRRYFLSAEKLAAESQPLFFTKVIVYLPLVPLVLFFTNMMTTIGSILTPLKHDSIHFLLPYQRLSHAAIFALFSFVNSSNE